MECRIQTVTTEALKALRCAHAQGGSPSRRIYGSTYKVKVALRGNGQTSKDPQQKRSYPPAVRNPLHTSEETGRFHARWSSPPHMHCLASQGAPMVKALKLATLNGQLECTVNDVGASDNSIKLKLKGKPLAAQISMKSSSGLYRSSMIGLQSSSTCRSPPKYSQTSVQPVTRPYS